VQQAAPTTLISQPAKAAVGLGVQAKAKTAFHEILGAKAAAAKETEQKDAQVRAALLKALSKNKTASDNAHLSDVAGVHGPSEGHGKKAAGNPGHALAGAAQGEQPPHQQADAGTLIAEAVDKKSDQKKKPAKAADHGSALASGGLAMAAVLGIKNLPRLDQKHAEQARADNVVSIHQAAGRKDHELRVHLVDARKKHAEVQTEDASGAVKAAKIIVADKDAAPAVVISRDAGFSDAPARETRGHSPIPQASTAAALERLREMAGSELTRAAGIILRDGGGELKLTLKPESLGNVRIRMNLVDNSIEGRIIVDNAAVKHIFEGSLSSLMRALTAEGFQTASLQVSVGGQNPDNGSRQDREPAPRTRRVDSIHGGSGLDWNVPAAENLSMGDLLVNLFV
jgi:flagellar hook-length control protein FliK